VDLEVISNENCERMERSQGIELVSYRGWIYDDMMCTFTAGKDACQGDSGGPLIVKKTVYNTVTREVEDDPLGDTLVGTVSWGVGCAFLPGVFSRIATSYVWIETTVCEESTDPDPKLCKRTTSPTYSVSFILLLILISNPNIHLELHNSSFVIICHTFTAFH
jgi:hypothetical protein